MIIIYSFKLLTVPPKLMTVLECYIYTYKMIDNSIELYTWADQFI